MENDAPVVGPDALTANSKMLKLGHCDCGLEPANFRFARGPGEGPAGVFTSTAPRCLDDGDVDLLHRHHRLEGTLCFAAASR